jgi:PAS domain S-box-containing protein
MSIRWRLILLVLASLLPLVLFAAFLVLGAYRSERASAERHASDTARALSIALDRELQGRIAALQALATAPSLLRGDIEGFRAQAAQVAADQPFGSAIHLSDANGRRLLDTRQPPGEALPERNSRESIRQVFASGQPVVSNVYLGALRQREVVAVEVPVQRDGRVVYDLALTLPLESFGTLLRAQRLSEDWLAWIVDRAGAVVASAGTQPGQALPSLAGLLPESQLGAVETKAAEEPQLLASSRSRLSGWSVAVSLPVALLERTLHRSLALTAGGGILLLLLGTMLAAFTARGIVQPIEALARGAVAGDRGPRVRPSGIREIDGLAEALGAASVARRRAVVELRASERQLRLIANSLPVLISYVDAEQRYRFVNHAYEEWFGKPREEIEGRHLREVQGEAMYERLRGYVEAALAGQKVQYEAHFPSRNGASRWVEATYVPRIGADGRTQGYYVLVADISERRRAEEAARASEERLRLARAAAGIGLWDWDVQKGELLWSDETFRIHGLEPGSAKPSYETWFATMHPDDHERMAREVAERSYLRRDPDYEFRTVWPDGSVHWVISKGRVFRDEDDRVVRLTGVIYDVTQMREAAEALRTINETLAERVATRTRQLEREAEQRKMAEAALLQAQKLEAVGKLTGGVAHDFNNLLTTVIGNLELIGRAVAADERVRKLVTAAERAATRGARLTESLLAFARVRPMRRETIDVNLMVQEFSALVRRAVGEAVYVELDLDSAVDSIHTDPAQLEAALLNLALNARDAMPEGGTLRLQTRNRTLGGEDLADNEDARPGGFVEICVADTGIGIPEEVRRRVFEPFFTTKEIGKGSGLGLSQVFGFARQSGGDVRLESALGGGTTVRLLLPSVPARPPEPEVVVPAGEPTCGGRAVILLVEDDAGVRDVTAELLTALGYGVLTARDGPEALTVLREHADIDLVFSDIVMPGGMSGVTLARRARELRPEAQVLLTSGYAEAALAAENATDEFDLLRKPYNQLQLVERVRAALDRAPVDAAPT